MRYTILPLLLLLWSCSEVEKPKTYESLEYVCTCDQKKAATEFVKISIEPANNKSDEEMEDVILQLYRTAIKLHCQQRTIKSEVSEHGWNIRYLTPLKPCEEIVDL